MTNNLHIAIALLLIGAISVHADLLDCDELSIGDIPGIGPKLMSDEQKVRGVFKDWGCSIQKGVKKIGAKMSDLGSKLKERAKDFGSDISSRFSAMRQSISENVHEDDPKRYVEIVDPDILKGEQICGHGHILDALGNCSKLRK